MSIDIESLDEDNPMCIFILYLYSMDSFIHQDMQRARDNDDASKNARYLGPYATIFGAVMGHRRIYKQI